MLSSDILTEFRGRSDEIRVHPLSFAEYYSAVGGDKYEAFDNYAFYGGMPLILSRPTDVAKMNYLQTLFSEVYAPQKLSSFLLAHPPTASVCHTFAVFSARYPSGVIGAVVPKKLTADCSAVGFRSFQTARRA